MSYIISAIAPDGSTITDVHAGTRRAANLEAELLRKLHAHAGAEVILATEDGDTLRRWVAAVVWKVAP